MPASASTTGYLRLIATLQLEHFPCRKIQLRIGTFCRAVIGFAHDGQRERGKNRLSGSAAGATAPASSAHSARHSRSSICGRRWMTTLGNEPTARPTANATQGKTAGWARNQPIDVMCSDGLAHLEDRQEHGDQPSPG